MLFPCADGVEVFKVGDDDPDGEWKPFCFVPWAKLICIDTISINTPVMEILGKAILQGCSELDASETTDPDSILGPIMEKASRKIFRLMKLQDKWYSEHHNTDMHPKQS